MNELTQVFSAIELGDPQAAERLLPLVYDELRKLATRRLAQEKPGQTLQATALVHDAYLRLLGTDNGEPWQGRGHFFAAAAEAMRRILVENARRKRANRHGGRLDRHDIETVEVVVEQGTCPEELLALDEALSKLAAEDPTKARLVELRYFAGLSEEEAAELLGISRSTAYRHWRYAKAWLLGELRRGDDLDP